MLSDAGVSKKSLLGATTETSGPVFEYFEWSSRQFVAPTMMT